MDYDILCMSFVCSSVSLSVGFLVSGIFVVGGVAYVYMRGFLIYVYMRGFLIDRVRLCFGFVHYFIYICVLFSFLYFVLLFLDVAPQLSMRT